MHGNGLSFFECVRGESRTTCPSTLFFHNPRRPYISIVKWILYHKYNPLGPISGRYSGSLLLERKLNQLVNYRQSSSREKVQVIQLHAMSFRPQSQSVYNVINPYIISVKLQRQLLLTPMLAGRYHFDENPLSVDPFEQDSDIESLDRRQII